MRGFHVLLEIAIHELEYEVQFPFALDAVLRNPATDPIESATPDRKRVSQAVKTLDDALDRCTFQRLSLDMKHWVYADYMKHRIYADY